jgi:hypothetical protein
LDGWGLGFVEREKVLWMSVVDGLKNFN